MTEPPIQGDHPNPYVDGPGDEAALDGGEGLRVAAGMASAVNAEGFREILGVCKGPTED